MIIYANLNLYIGGQVDNTLLFNQATVMNVLNLKMCSLISYIPINYTKIQT